MVPPIECDISELIDAIDEVEAKKVDKTSIVDNLTTDDATKVLSANQGKVLKDTVDLLDDEIIRVEQDKVDKVVGKGLSTEDYTSDEKNKLADIASGAEVNVQSDWDAISGDAFILNKPSIPTKVSDLTNDTGYITGYTETDPIFIAWDKSTGISITKSQVSDFSHTHTESDITDLDKYTQAQVDNLLNDKVDKVTGKGLSTNDYTTDEKDKLAGIDSGAQVNVQSDWTQEVNTADDYIKNKPAIPTKVSDLTNDEGFIKESNLTDIEESIEDLELAVSTKANDNAVVKLTGNQSIGGIKKFHWGFTL